jgi:hypothetical protein
MLEVQDVELSLLKPWGDNDLTPKNCASCNWGTSMIKPLKGGVPCVVRDLRKSR